MPTEVISWLKNHVFTVLITMTLTCFVFPYEKICSCGQIHGSGVMKSATPSFRV